MSSEEGIQKGNCIGSIINIASLLLYINVKMLHISMLEFNIVATTNVKFVYI